MTFRLAIDVGGTFTDLVAADESGRVVFAKAPTTPDDPSRGVMDGLQRLAGELGLARREDLLAATGWLVHGTTVATNALVERKGARVGLLTTEGHRDVLEMREGLKHDRYNLRMPPPEPLVPRVRRLGVRERIGPDGAVAVPLHPASLRAAVRRLARERVEAVAVCYLHAYRNPAHERETEAAVARALPEAYRSVSSDVLPQIKEYERVCTTVVNAYVGPTLARYLHALAGRLRDAGYTREILIMQSHGGVGTVADAVRLAAGAILSGPAGGIAGGRHCARLLGAGNVLTFDMGGTSTDIALLEGGEPALAGGRVVGGHMVALPSLDIHTLGAGGGSIARVDAAGILHVGPQSAGAVPGPACYGRGGDAATVTDANLILGLLDPGRFLGGRAALHRAPAEAAVGRIAGRLGGSVLEAAEGIHRVVTTTMAEGIRRVSVRRGVDPRAFVLLAFGGAAGLHITQVARQLDIARVVVPRAASVLSAWGMLATDLRYELVRTHVADIRTIGAAGLRALFAEIEAEGRRRVDGAFPGTVTLRRSAEMRYGEQIFEVSVPLDDVDMDAPDLIDQVVARFRRRHEALYTYSAGDQDVVLVNARLAVVGALPAAPPDDAVAEPGPVGQTGLAGQTGQTGQAAPRAARRRIYMGGFVEAPVYEWETLRPGFALGGPAIVESATTTVVLWPHDRAQVTPRGWLDITVTAAGRPDSGTQ
jgi:N-methylhydantoinase A